MNKLRFIQIFFIVVAILAFIPLTIAVFGDKNPDTISTCAVFIAFGMGGNFVSAIIRVIYESKKK